MMWTAEFHTREIGRAIGRTEVAIGLRRAVLAKRQSGNINIFLRVRESDEATKLFFGRNEHHLLKIGAARRAICWISDLGFVGVK
jgi:hypothetical protein